MGAAASGACAFAGKPLGHVGFRLCLLRSVLLLEPPLWAHRRPLLGIARGASPKRRVQPDHCSSADRDRRVPELDLLSADGAVRRAAVGVPDGRRDTALLPVLAPHAGHRPHGIPGSLDTDAVKPPRAPCAKRYLPGQELCRRVPDMGSHLRQLPGRARRGAVYLRYPRPVEQLESGVGQPALLLGDGAGRAAGGLLGRQSEGMVCASRMAAAGCGGAFSEALI